MTYVSVRAAAQHLVRQGHITPHQMAALGRLDELLSDELSDEQRQEFTSLWRAGESPAAPEPAPQNELANLQSWLTFLTGPGVSRLSKNKSSPLTVAEACGFIGCIIVETGRPLLDELDVVESGSGAGRGAMQYTGVRRVAYDKARSTALTKGLDPGGNSWQQQYFAEEYAGLHDPPQGSLIGWTRVFEDRPAGMDPARAAVYFSEVYFRPGVPHLDRRQKESRRVWGLVPRLAGEVALFLGNSKPSPAPSPAGETLISRAVYFFQRDSATNQGDRMCFASTCAMAAETLKPGCLAGQGQPDDRYLRLLMSLGGDTTDVAAQVRALKSLGIEASFQQELGRSDLSAQIRAGRPVPVGWIHQGPVDRPRGDGHWSLVVGFTESHWIIHDPFGEAALVEGGYVSTAPTAGRFVRYSKKNFNRRWMVEPHRGGYRFAPGKGWGLILGSSRAGSTK